jgi:succinoglycan biosynthesis transport protein ExoP
MPEGAQYVAAMRRWWPLAVAIVAVAALMGLAVAAQRTTSYTATAKVLLGEQRQLGSLLGTSDYSPDPERDLNTSLQLITLEPIAAGVIDRLQLDESPAALAGRVATAVDRNSNIVTIAVRDADAARAAAIANAFAGGYRDYRVDVARNALRQAIASAQMKLPELRSSAARAALQHELTRLEVAEPLQAGDVQVVHEATAASAVRRPRPAVSGLLGGFLGLVIAAIAIVVLARTDRRVAGDRDLEALTGRPVLARIPRSRRAAADAFASLALALTRTRPRGAPAAVVLITSADAGEGTPDVALGLTRALGAIGRRAVAIEADLRRPEFGQRLGLGPRGGLAAILAGDATIDEELAAIGQAAAVVPAGAVCDLPQALLAGDAMAATVEEARERAEVVVLVAVAGDAVALAALVDEVLLVSRDDVTRPDGLRRAMRALADAGAPRAGLVATARPAGWWLGPGATRQRHGAATQSGSAATAEVTVG